MKIGKYLKSEPGALALYSIVQGLFAFGVWQLAVYIHPIEQQMEINDLNIRLENCHWQLLKRNAEIGTLTKSKELDSLIKQSREDSVKDEASRYKYIDSLK